MAKSQCFKKITNDDIYKKLISIEKHVIETNGKVKLNRWIASSALSLGVAIAGLLLTARIF